MFNVNLVLGLTERLELWISSKNKVFLGPMKNGKREILARRSEY